MLAAGKNLYLAGFMGAGKTATARALARALGAGWTDLDREVEDEAGMNVAEIFGRQGERAFRAAEHRALARAVRAGGRVVALGGGTVCFARNRALLRGTGPVVVLTADEETIWRRVRRAGTRPLLAGEDGRARVRDLLARRARDYRRYRLRVDTAALGPREAAAAVLEAVEVAGRRPPPLRTGAVARARGGSRR